MPEKQYLKNKVGDFQTMLAWLGLLLLFCQSRAQNIKVCKNISNYYLSCNAFVIQAFIIRNVKQNILCFLLVLVIDSKNNVAVNSAQVTFSFTQISFQFSIKHVTVQCVHGLYNYFSQFALDNLAKNMLIIFSLLWTSWLISCDRSQLYFFLDFDA